MVRYCRIPEQGSCHGIVQYTLYNTIPTPSSPRALPQNSSGRMMLYLIGKYFILNWRHQSQWSLHEFQKSIVNDKNVKGRHGFSDYLRGRYGTYGIVLYDTVPYTNNDPPSCAHANPASTFFAFTTSMISFSTVFSPAPFGWNASTRMFVDNKRTDSSLPWHFCSILSVIKKRSAISSSEASLSY